MTQSKSLLRREEYRALGQLSFEGAILDVGGSKKSGYHELIGGTHTITTANIDESYGTDIIFDAQEHWPCKDASFDGVLLVNVLEHLYHYDRALDEAVRVLRPGGTIAGVVPFMLNIHGTPHDHFRYTRRTLELLLEERGFKEITVEELGTGVFGVIYQCLLGAMRFSWMANLGIGAARALDAMLAHLKPGNKLSVKEMPLGYFFKATK